MSLDLSDDDRKQLAKDLAAELDTGLYGNRAVLSRRQLLSIAGGSAGVAGLVALGVDPATAQSAAGQVGTEASPEDVFAYDLDVQGALQRDLDAGGQAISNVGSVSTGNIANNDYAIGSTEVLIRAEDGDSRSQLRGQATNNVSTSPKPIMTFPGEARGALLIVVGDNVNAPERFTDVVQFTVNASPQVVNSVDDSGPAGRSYSREGPELDLAMGSGTYRVSATAIYAGVPF